MSVNISETIVPLSLNLRYGSEVLLIPIPPPSTSNLSSGLVVPIPTLPDCEITRNLEKSDVFQTDNA